MSSYELSCCPEEEKDNGRQKFEEKTRMRKKRISKRFAFLFTTGLLMVPTFLLGKVVGEKGKAEDDIKKAQLINFYVNERINSRLTEYDAMYLEVFNNITFNYYLNAFSGANYARELDVLLSEYLNSFDQYTEDFYFFDQEAENGKLDKVVKDISYQKR